eukprot:4145054-Amphidinium_carterae.10
MCQKYIGQLMWLSTRTRPDISACLGILATLMVKRPRECVSSLVHLWRYVYSTSELAMTTAHSASCRHGPFDQGSLCHTTCVCAYRANDRCVYRRIVCRRWSLTVEVGVVQDAAST